MNFLVSARPEPGALGLGLRAIPDLAEFLEHRIAILRSNADAGVRHAHFYRIVHRACSNRNAPTLRREFTAFEED